MSDDTSMSQSAQSISTGLGLTDTTHFEQTVPTVKRKPYNEASILEPGQHFEELPILKKKMNWIGYGGIDQTTLFGPYLKKRIKELQSDSNMQITGIIDQDTKRKINERFATLYQYGSEHYKIRQFKKKLKELGFGYFEDTPLFDNITVKQVKAFQHQYGIRMTGQVCDETLNIMNDIFASPFQLNKRHKETATLKKYLNYFGYGPIKTTKKFGRLAEEKLKLFQMDYDLPASGIADKLTWHKMEELMKVKEKKTFVEYDLTLEEANVMHRRNAGKDYFIKNGAFPLNPDRYLHNSKSKFLFLNLTRPYVAEASVLNHYLDNKGPFAGQGQTFIDAAVEHDINEMLLIATALSDMHEETMHPVLGIPLDRDGNITYIEKVKNGQSQVVPGQTSNTNLWVYNAYGNTYDTMEEAADEAYHNGWNTLEQSIMEGAKAVKNKYLPNGHNTLYNMIWTPPYLVHHENTSTQTVDIEWVAQQRDLLHDLHQQLESYTLYLEIPVYNDK